MKKQPSKAELEAAYWEAENAARRACEEYTLASHAFQAERDRRLQMWEEAQNARKQGNEALALSLTSALQETTDSYTLAKKRLLDAEAAVRDTKTRDRWPVFKIGCNYHQQR